jgi:hypothetical protein
MLKKIISFCMCIFIWVPFANMRNEIFYTEKMQNEIRAIMGRHGNLMYTESI